MCKNLHQDPYHEFFAYISCSLDAESSMYVCYADEGGQALSWEERLQIALDISHGIEYLHDGVGCGI